jgi:hypothetical protein
VLTPMDGQRYQLRHATPPATSPPHLAALPPRSLGEWSELFCQLGPHLSDSSSYRSTSLFPTCLPGLTLFETGHHRAHRCQLQQQTTAAATADFLALYERCVSNGLKACININNSAGYQEISLTCQVPAAIASAQRHRHRCPR